MIIRQLLYQKQTINSKSRCADEQCHRLYALTFLTARQFKPANGETISATDDAETLFNGEHVWCRRRLPLLM